MLETECRANNECASPVNLCHEVYNYTCDANTKMCVSESGHQQQATEGTA